ncbi:TrbM/KikA/MpfK family conjugal transfer protein [Candidatus Pantoea formicae]|uniref:TrbM/KikA/MpfK family conjugal transfer protein n=1 Tax=Candidatus Pantoea formicae TaxID=2608355 RepID=UPI003EDAB3AE
MKKLTLSLLITSSLLALSSLPAHASSDPCEVVLCMYGKVTGNSGGSDCSSAESTFFDIVKKNKHGFLADHTSDARKDFINQCTTAPAEYINSIISKYGKVRL